MPFCFSSVQALRSASYPLSPFVSLPVGQFGDTSGKWVTPSHPSVLCMSSVRYSSSSRIQTCGGRCKAGNRKPAFLGTAGTGFLASQGPQCSFLPMYGVHLSLSSLWTVSEEADHYSFGAGTLSRKKKVLVTLRDDGLRRRPHLNISMPHDFRPVSSIIDVDILPETHRRVRLYRHGYEKPLGFYIRDGTSVRVTPHGLEKVPGIFISRMVPGGLAESTGLLAVNDEVLEVNGIEVAGKTLDQVTDMMIANSHNLIVTVKPANQRNNVVRSSRTSGSSVHSTDSTTSHHSLPGAHVLQNSEDVESDEEADIVIEGALEPQHIPKTQAVPPGSLSRANGTSLAHGLHRRDMSLHSSGRESNGSIHRFLSSLKPDPRHSLVLPQGGVEEHGPAITL